MIKSLIDDHEELLSSMNWSFLPPEKSKEPWPKTRHAVLLGSFIIVQYDWNCYLWYHCFFLFFFLHLYIWPCICVLCLQISDQRYKGFKCKNRWKCCIVDIAKKKKEEENMIAILCLVNMFSICTLLEKTFWGEIYHMKD